MPSAHNHTSIWQQSVPDIAWGTIGLFLGLLAGYALVLSSTLVGALPYPVATVILSLLAFVSFTVAHDAGHGNVFKLGSRLKPLESVMGWIAAIPFVVVPYRLFQKIHDRHHAFTNDPERDPDYFKGPHDWRAIALTALQLPLRYHLISVTTLRHDLVFRRTYASTLIFLTLTLGSLIGLCLNGYALEVLYLVLAPPLIAGPFLAMVFDFIPHFPHKALGRYHNTNIYGGRLLNVLLLGQNYHLIHHMFPRLPWYKYRQVYLRIKPDLEANGAAIYESTWPSFKPSDSSNGFQRAGAAVDMVLRVADIERLTASSVAIRFANPVGPALKYSAGQYITVSKLLNGVQSTRCYSLCTSPDTRQLSIGVRATEGGLVSNYLNRELRVGDELIVQGPFGNFVYPPKQPLATTELLLIAGGSGITPIKAILESALADITVKRIHLLYANRSPEEVMFASELAQLQIQYEERFKVTYVCESAPTDWVGTRGRLSQDTLSALLSLDGGSTAHQTAYVCGPLGLKDLALATFAAEGVDAQRVFVEQFAAAAQAPEGEQFHVEIVLADGQSKSIRVASNQTVLEVAKAQGISIPHACCVGTCGTCKVKVEQGKVVPIADTIPGILREEQDEGFTLACQCRRLSALRLQECSA